MNTSLRSFDTNILLCTYFGADMTLGLNGFNVSFAVNVITNKIVCVSCWKFFSACRANKAFAVVLSRVIYNDVGLGSIYE